MYIIANKARWAAWEGICMKKVFIDGSAGTTGLRIFDRLHGRTDIQLLTLPESERKLESSRKRLLNEADVVFLCLPDDAAREAASWVENPDTVVLDTSTAHRTAPGWCYGFPELSPVQEARLRQAKRIAVPRLPRQRLYRAGLSAHFRRTACAGCASELLFADRLFRRRQKDDRGIPRAGAKSSPERAAPVRARPDAQAPEGNEGCHWSCKRAGLLSGRRGFLQRYAGDGSAVCGLAEAGRRHGGGKTPTRRSIPARSSPIRTRRMRAASCPLPHSPVWTA